MRSGQVTERGVQSRRRILDAAAEVFARDGYAAASTGRILDAAGVTKGGLYFHFASKEALALEVLADQQERSFEQTMEAVERLDDPLERLGALPLLLARMHDEGRGPWALRRLVDELCADPRLRPQVSAGLRRWVDAAADGFARAQAAGRLRADVDPQLLAEVLVSSFNGMQAFTDQLGDGRLLPRVTLHVDLVRRAVALPEPGGSA